METKSKEYRKVCSELLNRNILRIDECLRDKPVFITLENTKEKFESNFNSIDSIATFMREISRQFCFNDDSDALVFFSYFSMYRLVYCELLNTLKTEFKADKVLKLMIDFKRSGGNVYERPFANVITEDRFLTLDCVSRILLQKILFDNNFIDPVFNKEIDRHVFLMQLIETGEIAVLINKTKEKNMLLDSIIRQFQIQAEKENKRNKVLRDNSDNRALKDDCIQYGVSYMFLKPTNGRKPKGYLKKFDKFWTEVAKQPANSDGSYSKWINHVSDNWEYFRSYYGDKCNNILET